MDLLNAEIQGDSRDFMKYAVTHILSKPIISVPTRILNAIQEIALAHLSVPDMFKLRDRYDGQAYYDRLTLKILSLYIIEKELSREILDLNHIKKNKDADLTMLNIAGNAVRVIPFVFGSLPLVDSSSNERLVFCAIRPNFKSGAICGIIDLNSDQNLFLNTPNSYNQNLKKFIGFEKLLEFKSIL